MTTMQVNAELYRAMGEIADDKALMEMGLEYDKRLEAALAKFSSDWGGDGAPEEIAEKLKRKPF